MKKIMTLISATVLLQTSLTAQLSYLSGENIHFWGSLEINDLEKSPYTQWFAKNMAAYKPKIKEEAYYQNLKDIEVTIFLGTWCGDSKKYLPQFIKTWRSLRLPEENLHLIAVHNQMDNYKMDPERKDSIYGIHRVPTFIFQKEGHEIGRIIESPQIDFETDLAQIALGIPSEPNYNSVTYLQNIIQSESIDSLNSWLEEIASNVKRKITKPSELTTYAKKLEADGKLLEAEFVLDVVTLIYPYNPYVYYAKGRYFKNQNEENKASDLFIKALTLEPNFESAKTQLLDLN